MPSRSPLLATLTLLALAFAPAFAGIPPADQTAKQVTQQFGAETKLTLKELNGQIKAASAELKLALKPISARFKAGDATTEDAADLFDALNGFQTAMAAVSEGADALLGAVFVGVSTLDPADDSFAGAYPADFMPGAGGRLDAALASLERALAKPYASLGKQLVKLQRLAEKQSGLLLAIRIAPVAGLFEQAINANAVTAGGRLPLTIDLTMSAHDSANGRVMWVAGSVTNYGQDVSVALSGQGSSTQDAVLADDRYQRSFVGFNPGNYLFSVRAEGDDQSVRQSIGLR